MSLVSPRLRAVWGLLTAVAFFSAPAAAFGPDDIIEATSLQPCMENSKLSADHFKVAFTPINNTVTYNVNITAEINGYVQALVDVYAYGFKIISETLDPCSLDASGLCPVYPGTNYLASTSHISSNIVKQIPDIAFTFPDIDAFVILRIYEGSDIIACIEADLSNRKTVDHVAVKWVTAVIAGIGLLVSAIISTLGNTYTAAHIAANSVSLFSYFQSVVIISMCAVQKMPPIASAWAQNIAWSVGLIHITFMQKIFRWYVAATGGTPAENIFAPTISVLVQKRDLFTAALTNHNRDLLHRAADKIFGIRRDDKYASMPAYSSQTLLVLRGIKRIAFQANIEDTSAVLTAFTFFVLICVAVSICFLLFYAFVVIASRSKWSRADRFSYFRQNCFIMLKGTILRLLFIAFPSLLIFSFWEFVQHDSAAVIILAVFFLLVCLLILGWSAAKVYLTGTESLNKHNTPAYLLFSDPQILNRYGFLYVPYKAFSYYFIIPVLVYFFVKACFIGFAQNSGKTQAVAMFIIELAYLIGISYYKPYMDKSTNVINIIIAVVTLINSILVMFFSQLFHTPRAVASVMGIIFFLLNAIFSLVLLLYTLVSCGIVLLSRNPDSRYKPAADDRAAFIRDPKGEEYDAAELTALGDAARADHESNFVRREGSVRSVDDSESNFDEDENKYIHSSGDSYANVSANPFSENTYTPPPRFNGGVSREDSQSELIDSPTIPYDGIDRNSAIDARDSYNLGLVAPPGLAPGHDVTHTYTNSSVDSPHVGGLPESSSNTHLNGALMGDEGKKKSKWNIF